MHSDQLGPELSTVLVCHHYKHSYSFVAPTLFHCWVGNTCSKQWLLKLNNFWPR